MKGLVVGCRGFAVGRERYFRELSAVEVSDTRRRLPRPATARGWREEAPPGFVFSLVAPAAVTHPPEGTPRPGEVTGHFRSSPAVLKAWLAFEAVAEAVAPRFVVFETPASFYPHAGMIKDMYAFFRHARRMGATFVWAAHGGGWEPRMKAKVAADLKLVLAADPVNGDPGTGPVRYFRAAGKVSSGRLDRNLSFSDRDLSALRHAAHGAEAYAFLANADRWRDARRLRELELRCAA